ncbi:MAG TPA: hypothetical protein VFN50_08645 [Acidimicrobiales bacterium]|nr:hypothetical protein [Acidimicrobiales bacterium]
MTGEVHVGNAEVDGPSRRGWLVGHFMEPDDPRHETGVEVKWGAHPAGEERPEWVAAESRSALILLVEGRFTVELPSRRVRLERRGDYVLFRGVPHTWRAEEDSVLVVVRWPSLEGYGAGGPELPVA